MSKEKKEKITIDSSIESLKSQLVEYRNNAERFNRLVLKTEGALEVLSQIKESEENGES